MISQVQVDEVPDAPAACVAVLKHKDELLALADAAVPNLVRRGGGSRGLEVRDLGDGMLVVHFLIDCRDAMGANLVNTVAEAVADRIAELSGGQVGLRILSNLCDKRCVRVRCSIPVEALSENGQSGVAVRDGIVRASRFAEADPYRAATHNKGIMNGVDPVILATGNDWRAAESGAHAFAARSGTYRPLCVWRKAENGNLEGFMEIPLALGVVGGPARMHKGAALGLKMSGVSSAQELAMLAASVGMASNFAALRALATDGIQRGHMGLHARQVAVAAGAVGDEVERVAKEIHGGGHVTLDAAQAALLALRKHDGQTQNASL
jgi:hydroxymethylglutaryl-CoA reductase